jgi:hypothetical protein
VQNDKLLEAINKVQDQRLRDLLLTYRAITKPALLFEILDYLNVKIVQEKLGAIITNIELDQFNEGTRIYLGAVVIDGELYSIELIVYNDSSAFVELIKSVDTILYRQEVS